LKQSTLAQSFASHLLDIGDYKKASLVIFTMMQECMANNAPGSKELDVLKDFILEIVARIEAVDKEYSMDMASYYFSLVD
jgi:hypothetical protein